MADNALPLSAAGPSWTPQPRDRDAGYGLGRTQSTATWQQQAKLSIKPEAVALRAQMTAHTHKRLLRARLRQWPPVVWPTRTVWAQASRPRDKHRLRMAPQVALETLSPSWLSWGGPKKALSVPAQPTEAGREFGPRSFCSEQCVLLGRPNPSGKAICVLNAIDHEMGHPLCHEHAWYHT